MRQPSNHLSSSAVLNEQGVFAADPGAPRHVRHFDEQARLLAHNWRYVAVDNALVGMNFGGSQAQLHRILIARREGATQDVSQLRFVVDQPLQRFTVRTACADAEYVLCCRVQADDQQILIEQNDSRTQTIEDIA